MVRMCKKNESNFWRGQKEPWGKYKFWLHKKYVQGHPKVGFGIGYPLKWVGVLEGGP